MFDINLIPINHEKGAEQGALPGLVTLTPPRKTARGRENDLLVAMISISGTAGGSTEGLNAWLLKKAEEYYKTAGTVTFALKTLVESLNDDLMQRNLKRAKEGQRLTAALNLAVLRRANLYLVTIGSARAYFVNSTESVEFADPETQRGLGIDQMLTCRFSQREVTANDVLILSCQPPEFWRADIFAGCNSLSNEAIGRRLFNQVGGTLKASLIRFTPGRGVVYSTTLETKTAGLPVGSSSVENPPAAAETVIEKPVLPAEEPTRPTEEPAVPSTLPVSSEIPIVQANTFYSSDRLQQFRQSAKAGQGRPVNESRRNSSVTQPGPTKPSEVKVAAGRVTKQVVSGVNKAGSAFSNFMQKILPGMADEPLKLTRGALIGIAVIIPVVVLFLAGMVYIKAGRSKEFDKNLVMAQDYAMKAEVQIKDPPVYLASLQQAMFWLDKAESYGQSDASTALRLKVQGELDILQGIQRLEMAEVIPGGLPAGTNVVQIVATATDVYFLDDKSGTVKHFSLGSSGYQADNAFDCGPNPDNPLNILDKLVDIVPLDVNNEFKATLLAIDGLGNIEFCVPGDAGITGTLSQPDQGWKKIKSISINGNYLYVLDIGGNAVYRYEGNGILYENKPTLFFDDQIPSLTAAIDIEVNGDELYILRSNGQMVECTYSHMKDYKLTECVDPALYGDMRTGQVPEAISFPEANFIQMRLTAAPDSSIYLLDETTKALYHFSLQRNLQKILHPRLMNGINVDQLTPSAVAVSSGRIAFMAFGSQIYYAPLP